MSTWTSRSFLFLQIVLSVALAACIPFNSLDCPTLEEFYKSPGVAGPCGKAVAAEGSTVCVTGLIDWNNVLEQERKFTLTGSRYTIEVWVETPQSREIFSRILERKGDATRVAVRGTCVGFDMPVMGKCLRGVKIVLTSAGDLQFGQ
ncbi:MAG TPA: hypothetical protein VNT26_14305 [Candidatus Sulfotelmatobacter sp.]|nr:hypothetical protein [Candidatus Sulfotelmatobacter sp.]